MGSNPIVSAKIKERKMNDREKFVKLMEEFGVVLTDDGDGDLSIYADDLSNDGKKGGPKQCGFGRFLTTWYFDNKGNFKEVGIWE